jgi:hypothetical protein
MNEMSAETLSVVVEREIPHPPKRSGARLPNHT